MLKYWTRRHGWDGRKRGPFSSHHVATRLQDFVVQRHLSGVGSHAAIGGDGGVSPGTLRSRLHHARMLFACSGWNCPRPRSPAGGAGADRVVSWSRRSLRGASCVGWLGAHIRPPHLPLEGAISCYNNGPIDHNGVMTVRLELTDSTLTKWTTSGSLQGDLIRLDESAFFPGGGGQVADEGTVRWEGGMSLVNLEISSLGV